jgi:hypothetical protein
MLTFKVINNEYQSIINIYNYEIADKPLIAEVLNAADSSPISDVIVNMEMVLMVLKGIKYEITRL